MSNPEDPTPSAVNPKENSSKVIQTNKTSFYGGMDLPPWDEIGVPTSKPNKGSSVTDQTLLSGTADAVAAPSEPLAPKTELSEEELAEFAKLIADLDGEVPAPKIDLVSLGPWSTSKYKTLKKCPFQFYLKYILKLKIPEHFQLQSDPVSANVGKAAHEILENVLLGKSVDASYAKVRKNYVDKKVLSAELWEEKVTVLYYNITQFKERIEAFGRQNKIKRVLTELRIGITRDFQTAGFFDDDVWLRGVIDLVIMLENGDIIIFDHKTGGGQGSVKMYQDQLDWYKILFHFGINKIEGAQTGVHFIAAGEVKMAEYSHHTEIESKLKNTMEMSIEGAIDSMLEKGYFKHVRGSYCKWCDYDNLGCKSGALKPIELGTKKWIPIRQA
jgi:hypothetical protein